MLAQYIYTHIAVQSVRGTPPTPIKGF